MEKILNSEGLLLPQQSPRKSPTSDEEMNERETNMPGMLPKEMLQSSQESIPNAQTPPRESRKRIREMHEGTNHRRDSSNGTNGRPRKPQRSDEKTALEMSVKKSEESIAKLQEHLDNNTCPKTLRYSAWQKIRPDPEFKSDINKIRKEVERKLPGALIPLP